MATNCRHLTRCMKVNYVGGQEREILLVYRVNSVSADNIFKDM
jgi:hypothetical protein